MRDIGAASKPHRGSVVDPPRADFDPEVRLYHALAQRQPAEERPVLDAGLDQPRHHEAGHAVALDRGGVQRVKEGAQALQGDGGHQAATLRTARSICTLIEVPAKALSTGALNSSSKPGSSSAAR